MPRFLPTITRTAASRRPALRYLEMAAERADSLGEASHTLQLWMRARRAASAIGDASAEARATERIRDSSEAMRQPSPDRPATTTPMTRLRGATRRHGRRGGTGRRTAALWER